MGLLYPVFQPGLRTFTAPGIGLPNGPIRRAGVPLSAVLIHAKRLNKKGMTTLADRKGRLMDNQDVREEDARADAEFALIEAMITARREAN